MHSYERTIQLSFQQFNFATEMPRRMKGKETEGKGPKNKTTILGRREVCLLFINWCGGFKEFYRCSSMINDYIYPLVIASSSSLNSQASSAKYSPDIYQHFHVMLWLRFISSESFVKINQNHSYSWSHNWFSKLHLHCLINCS